jgi:hypothetical protein
MDQGRIIEKKCSIEHVNLRTCERETGRQSFQVGAIDVMQRFNVYGSLP